MIKYYQIVIDTNVILAGLRSKNGASYKLLSILEEINDIINGICYIANHHEIFYIWRPLAKDKDDDFLIDLALKCQAKFIISYNDRDLKPIEKFGVSILTPKQFLQLLGEINS